MSCQQHKKNYKPKILFRVDANNKIGWGHFYRSLALADMLKNDFDIQFAMAVPPSKSLEELEKKHFECLSIPPQEYTTPDHRGNAELEFDLAESVSGIDIVILDGYWFGHKYQQHLRQYSVKVVIIEDDGKGEYLADMIVNHAPNLAKESYHSDNENCLFALGPQYAMLRPSFLKVAKEQYAPKSRISKIFVAFGGSDYFNLSYKIIRWLLTSTALDVQVVVGSGYQHLTDLKGMVKLYPDKLRLSRNLSEGEMVAAMKRADLGIVPASGMLFEAISCRLPTITGLYTDNQRNVYNGFLKKAVAMDGGSFTNLSQMERHLQEEDLEKYQERQAEIIDGYSAERLMVLLKILAKEKNLRIRHAETDDARLFYNWANDQAVRANAFSQEKITWEDHLQWYKSKLGQKSTKLLVLECSEIPLGQIRFDKDDDGFWVIDYSVDKRFRGMGFGSIVVRKGVEHLKAVMDNIKMKAEVKSENVSSIKVFRKMKFGENFKDGVFCFTVN